MLNSIGWQELLRLVILLELNVIHVSPVSSSLIPQSEWRVLGGVSGYAVLADSQVRKTWKAIAVSCTLPSKVQNA
jgi:hypothetical protein